MKLRLLLAALLAMLAVAAFAQNSDFFAQKPSDQQRIAELEKKVSMLQDRVSKLEEETAPRFKQLTQ